MNTDSKKTETEQCTIPSVRQRYLKSIIDIVGDIEEKDSILSERLDELDFIEIIMQVELDLDIKIIEEQKRITDFETIKDLIDWMQGFNVT
jgi:acyl carrier protein